VSESAVGLPLRATGEFRAPKLPLGGAVSGSTAAIDPRTLAPRVVAPDAHVAEKGGAAGGGDD